jgi:hypothetical protein
VAVYLLRTLRRDTREEIERAFNISRSNSESSVVQRMSAKISNPPASPVMYGRGMNPNVGNGGQARRPQLVSPLMACKAARQRTPLSVNRMGCCGQWRAGDRQLRESIEKLRAQVRMSQEDPFKEKKRRSGARSNKSAITAV